MTVPGTEHGELLGVLRFDFDHKYDIESRLKEVSWDEFFITVDECDLIFIYQEHLKNGYQSNFFHFDSPHRIEIISAQSSDCAQFIRSEKMIWLFKIMDNLINYCTTVA